MKNGRMYNLSHCTYTCKYHIIWTPKYRGKILASTFIKQELKRIFKSIAKWKGFVIHAWHIGDDHIHLYMTIPPKHSVSYAMAILKGKSSAWIKKKTSKLPQGSLWERGYYVTTVGIDEEIVKNYVQKQHERHKDVPRLSF